MRIPALMAVIYALGLAMFETLVNWGQWQWWPWWLVDYVAAAVLLAGGVLALRGQAQSDVPLGTGIMLVGWGFALGMMWMSLAGNIAEGTDPARDGRVAGFYISLIVLSMIYCLVGLMLTIRSDRTAQSKL